MPKIDIETLKFILQRNEPDIRKVSAVMQEIEMELRAEAEEKANQPPAIKWQYVGLISKDSVAAFAQGDSDDIVGWIVEIPEDSAPFTAYARLVSAAYEFNTTPKGRRMPVEKIGETCEVFPPKLLKEQGLRVKTKQPILFFPIPNRIPFDGVSNS